MMLKSDGRDDGGLESVNVKDAGGEGRVKGGELRLNKALVVTQA